MLALCQEHRLEHRTKHIALRYFLARELQQRGQLRLAYVASQANTADVFTKALQPCDHQPCFAFLDWSCDLLFFPTLPMGFIILSLILSQLAPPGWPHKPCAVLPCPLRFPSARALPHLRAALLVARHPALPSMASLTVLRFDHEGHPIQFDTWLDDLHLYLLSDSRDSVSLFDHTAGASLAPSATADSATCSQWLTRDATAHLAIRNHLFPELFAFATVEDLVIHLRTSDARYHSALPAKDHFLALLPTDLIVELLEKHLLAAETSVVNVGAARGTPPTPFFEGCSPFPLAADVPHLVAMLLAPEGDPDAPDIRTPRSYAKAITYPVPPSGANIVDGMWILRGVDFFQTFSPTPKMTTRQVLLHVTAQHDYELHSLDFITAFMQGSLHEEIWLRRPPGSTRSFPAGTQWSLRRPVYGLRQAPRKWHDTLRTTLAALGFAHLTADPSLFLRTDTLLPSLYVLVYVNDFVFAIADTEALALVKSELHERHTYTDLGELRSYLGLHITQDIARHTITLTQSHMVHQVLQRFGFRYSSPQSTPLPTDHSLSASPSDESVEPSGPYPKLVGCLMYLMTCTLPDLAYPLNILARYVAPGRHRPEHWEAAKRVLHYLCSTSGMGLVLGGRGPVVLTGHAYASWVDDLATQWSSHGYTFSLASGSVSWRSTRLSSVLSSSCEAKIYAGAMATQEHRTKHIALRYFLARELQQRGQLRLAYVAIRANTADIFTKALLSGW
ncbi:unnamed protein product [Closterium sp. NIES-53]